MRRARLAVLAAGAVVVVAVSVTAAVALAGGSGTPSRAPAPTPSRVTPPAVATSQGTALTAQQRALVASLGPLRVLDCAPAPPDAVTGPSGQGLAVGQGVDAAVACATNLLPGQPGPATLVARHYRDAAALGDDVARRSRAVGGGTGDCANGKPGTQTWGRADQSLGTFICAQATAPATTLEIFWSVTADQTSVSAASADDAGLIAWWRDFTKP
jgi:hypothetical protein